MSAKPLANLTEDISPINCFSLNVLVVYEDAGARARVEKVYESLTGQFSKDFCFGATWCGFQELKDPLVALETARAAADADLILFSASARIEPPTMLKAWVESWIARKRGRDGALGGLLNRTGADDGKTIPIQAYLTEVARRTGMDSIFEIISSAENTSANAADNGMENIIPLHHRLWNEAGPLSEFWPD